MATQQPESFDRIAGLRIFRGAGPDLVRRLAQAAGRPQRIAAGTANYDCGDPADRVYLALDATEGESGGQALVEVYTPVSDAQRQVQVGRVVASDIFGEIEFVATDLLAGAPKAMAPTLRRTSARAVADCMVLAFPFAALAEALDGAPALRQRLVRLAIDRLLTAIDGQTVQLSGNRDLGLARWLVDRAEGYGLVEGNRVRFRMPNPQREIAEALGLSRESISLRLSEWERAGLIRTGGPTQELEIVDYARVALRAALNESAPYRLLPRILDEIDTDLARGELVRARNVGLDFLAFLPSSPELRHRIALAAIRAGNPQESLDILAAGELLTDGDLEALRDRVRWGLLRPDLHPRRLSADTAEGPADETLDWQEATKGVQARLGRLVEDVAAITARARKEAAFLVVDTAERSRNAALSAEEYGRIYDFLGGTYAGVNAATMRAVAGDRPAAVDIAKRVIADLGAKPAGYWPLATLGEARLVLGDAGAAEKAFRSAAEAADATDGLRLTTRLQIARVAPYLGADAGTLLKALPVGWTTVYSGLLFRGREMDDARQTAEETRLRGEIAAVLDSRDLKYAYGALACGADIVIAEEILARGGELNVVLPFPVDDFHATSVAIGNPPDAPRRWDRRYHDCLQRAISVSSISSRTVVARHRDDYYRQGLRVAGGRALLRADALVSDCLMLATDRAREASLTARALAEWVAEGRPAAEIDFAPGGKNGAAPVAAGTSCFRPVVFLWPADADAPDAAAVAETVRTGSGLALDLVPRTAKDRRHGIGIVATDVATAIAVAGAAAKAEARLRIVCDFGPVLDGSMALSPAAVARLAGAGDLPGFPLGKPIATGAFATEARMGPDAGIQLVPIGRSVAGAAAGRGQPAQPAEAVAAEEVYAVVSRRRAS